MMKAIRDKTSKANTPTTRDPAPLGVIIESEHSSVLLGFLYGHSSVLLGSLYGQLIEGILLCVELYKC